MEGGVEATGQLWLVAGSVLRTSCVAKALRIDAGANFSGEFKVGE